MLCAVGPHSLSCGGVGGDFPSPNASSDQLPRGPDVGLLQRSNDQNETGSPCVHELRWAQTTLQDMLKMHLLETFSESNIWHLRL